MHFLRSLFLSFLLLLLLLFSLHSQGCSSPCFQSLLPALDDSARVDPGIFRKIDDHLSVRIVDAFGIQGFGNPAKGLALDNELLARFGGKLDPDHHYRVSRKFR